MIKSIKTMVQVTEPKEPGSPTEASETLLAKKVDLEGFREVPFVELPFTDFAGDVPTRWQAMNGVLQGIIDSYPEPRILDIASGGGHDTLYLQGKGYNVEANEFDPAFRRLFQLKAAGAGLQPVIHQLDWREFLAAPEIPDEQYDLLFALGNSFPNYLPAQADRIKSLQGFWRILKPGRALFFDTRNYDYFLSDAAHILEDPENNFRYDYTNTYINDQIHGFPVEIGPEKVKMLYKHYPRRTWGALDLWPATEQRVLGDIQAALGDVVVQRFYDYKKERPEHFDFEQFVITKPE